MAFLIEKNEALWFSSEMHETYILKIEKLKAVIYGLSSVKPFGLADIFRKLLSSYRSLSALPGICQ